MVKERFKKLTDITIKRKIVIMMFALVTITPTILVGLLASVYYHLGIETLFNEKISNALAETVKVSERYLHEHRDSIKIDVLRIANDIDQKYYESIQEPGWLDAQAERRGLTEAMIFAQNGIIAKTRYSFPLLLEKLPEEAILQADRGEVAILRNDNDSRVRAIIRLNNFFTPTYLFVGRYVDPNILNHLRNTQGSASQYESLLSDIKMTQVKLGIAFIVLSTILCLTAIGIGLTFARRLARPINKLLEATTIIQEGDFSVRVPEREAKDEIAVLSRAFNRMTEHIAKQREELVNANQLIDARRRFIETVLAEISSSVLVISTSGEVKLANDAASRLFAKSNQEIIDKHYDTILPEINILLKAAADEGHKLVQDNIIIDRGGKKWHLFIQVGKEINAAQQLENYIVTCDDISDLVAAQRAAAWADVARRVAHEIKNPLTPIRLSAERLQTKYGNTLPSGRETFAKYVNTIIRHSEDIGRIVEEFVNFARIPTPKFAAHDLMEMINEIVFSQRAVYRDVQYKIESAELPCIVWADKGQICQVLLNLLKNAAESIEILSAENPQYVGKINIKVEAQLEAHKVAITISDNGCGFSEEMLSMATEPYATSKPQGTGLGLAIVKKIIEEHGFALEFYNLPGNEGAIVKFALQLRQ